MSIIRFFNNETDGKVHNIVHIFNENVLSLISENIFVKYYYALSGKEFLR